MLGALTFIGDVMPGRLVGSSLERIGLAESARRVRLAARGEDASRGDAVVVANLECVLDEAGPEQPCKADGGPNLHASPAAAVVAAGRAGRAGSGEQSRVRLRARGGGFDASGAGGGGVGQRRGGRIARAGHHAAGGAGW